MHKDHPAFKSPSSADITIWRYMDLPKFISMLEDQALHFVIANEMPDQFEGSSTKFSIDLLQATFSRLYRESLSTDMPADLPAKMATVFQRAGKFTYLNCWHMNEHESAAMWALYQSGQPQGIAIRSTYQRLSESIVDSRTVYIGTVDYVDYDTDATTGLLTTVNRFLYKRRSFDHERELRAIYAADLWTNSTGPAIDIRRIDGSKMPPLEDAPYGPAVIPISVDLEALIEEIYVSPQARPWFAELIRMVLSRYGHGWNVTHSRLDDSPLY